MKKNIRFIRVERLDEFLTNYYKIKFQKLFKIKIPMIILFKMFSILKEKHLKIFIDRYFIVSNFS